ncbi:MAG: secondary thiamine-phosphate synthase enzyme YjbQ [Balneolales bacterium]|nr:secondary thiamine-phosphate synthase enzyme YjbQ [Balneolales bacterium]
MNIIQKEFQLIRKQRGFHIITDEILNHLPEVQNVRLGTLHVFVKHTSASLTINENADPTVREDFESFFKRTVPEDFKLYKHTLEGPDDMTSHIKSSLLGSSVTVPVTSGRLNLGTWQGIYFCEHRNQAGPRTIICTLQGIMKAII